MRSLSLKLNHAVSIAVKSIALGVLLAAISTATAQAGPKKPPGPASTECEEACLDEYFEDLEECEDLLAARLTALDAEEAICREESKDPITLGRCVHKVNVKRRVASNEERKCIARANTKAYNCYRQCAISESR